MPIPLSTCNKSSDIWVRVWQVQLNQGKES